MDPVLLAVIVVALAFGVVVVVGGRRARRRATAVPAPAPVASAPVGEVSAVLGEARPRADDCGPRELDEVFDGFTRAFRRAQQGGDAPIKVSPTIVEVGDDGATTGMSWTATITASGGRTQLSVPLVSVAAIRSEGRRAEVAQVGFSAEAGDSTGTALRPNAIARDPFAAFRPSPVPPRSEPSVVVDPP